MKKTLFIPLFLFLIVGGMYAQPGTIDPTFNTSIGVGANDLVTSVAVQADGKIIIAGEFTNYANTPKNHIVRLNADGTLDPTFNIGNGANSDISDVKLQSDGKIMIIGKFTAFNGLEVINLARLNSDGSVDTTFIPATGLLGYNSFAIQANGNILITGSYRDSNGFYATKIVRLEPNGALDTTFDNEAGHIGTVEEFAIQSDGKIVIVGRFGSYAGVGRSKVARINQDGTLDTTFDPGSGADNDVKTVVIQPDNKIIISGLFTTYNGSPTNGIARLNADGTKDLTFATNIQAKSTIYSIVLQANGKILVGGDFTSFNNTVANRIVRLNSDATIDPTFNSGIGVDKTVYCIAEQTDEKIIIAGDFSSYKETLRGRLARINGDGIIDTSFFNPKGFASGSNGNIVSTAIQADGKILVAGAFTFYNGTSRIALIRLNTDGTLDVPFNPFTYIGNGDGASEYCVAVQSDGKILLSGRHRYGTVFRYGLIRLNADGTPDLQFYVGPDDQNDHIYSIVMQTDGKIIIGGAFSTYTGVKRNGIARLNIDGTIDTSFDPVLGTNNEINSIAVQPDGKILIGGNFTTYNGVSRNRVARLNADGTLDTTFDPGSGANKTVNSLVVQTDGKILIGGIFTSYNSIAKNNIVRLNANGTLDTTFGSGTGVTGAGVNNMVLSIKVQLDKKIIIGGYFTSYDGISRNNIAILNADGTLDTIYDLGTGASSIVQDILIQPDGKIVIAGIFSSYNDNIVGRITRILSSDIELSTEEFNQKSLTIYPNPATNQIYFSEELSEIAVFDLLGKKINVTYSSNSADISALPQGIYILKGLENTGKTITQKIIKN